MENPIAAPDLHDGGVDSAAVATPRAPVMTPQPTASRFALLADDDDDDDDGGDGDHHDDDDLASDDDEAECRVCRGEAEPDRRLFAPCKCSGSIRFTHSDCLEQWLEHSGKSYCELCGHKFEFKPLYDASAPAVLPWSELVTTVLSVAFKKWFPFAVRTAMAIVLWLGVAPWCTSWLYRMWLLRASAMVNVNFSERTDTAHITADIFAGIVLIVVIIFSFLALMSFADFLRFHLDQIDEMVDEPLQRLVHHHHQRQHGHGHNQNQNQLDLAAADDQIPLAPEAAAPPARPAAEDDRPALFEGNNDDDESSDDEQDMDDANAVPFAGVFARHPIEELGLPVQNNIGAQIARDDAIEQIGQAIRPAGAAARDEAVRAQAAQQPAVPPRVAPAAAPRNRPMAGNNDPANNRDVWDDDFEHMEINIAMDELLGLRGDVNVLFRNVSWLLAFNGAYLGLFAFIPYTLGSTILTASMKIYSALPLASLFAFAADASTPVEELSVGPFFLRTLAKAIEGAKANGDCLQLVDLCTCFFGYVTICFTIVLWRWMVTTASPFIHRPLMGGVLWALRCLSAIVKVSTLLLLKMVLLPIVLGIGIDMATLRLFHVTLQDRIVFFFQNMVGALLVHWVLGITFMLFITVSVLQLREVMHPDILAKVIRPQEAHPDLLRSLLSETCMKHARRMLLSLVIYAALLVVLIHVPIRLCHAVASSMFPLELRFQHYIPEIQVPLELLIVHLVVLGILEHAKNEIGRFQHLGVVYFCDKLGLTSYLLPRVKATWTARGGEFVVGPPPLHFHPQHALPPDELRIPGHRYLPWPEEGLEDTQPAEYVLLRRRFPKKLLHARVATLVFISWFMLVATIGVILFGSFFLGRACMGPFERLTGIAHDPLALGAGVQIAWYLANGLNALNMVTMPEDQVEPALVRRGYCVKNMTPENAVACVVGWAFLCPFFVGLILSACFPAAKATWFESFWMGYLVFNLVVWFICCFSLKRNRRRRRNRQAAVPLDDEFEGNFDEFADQEDFLDDMMEDELDEDDDEDLVDGVDAAAAEGDVAHGAQDNNDDGGVRAPEVVVEADGIIAALRKNYKQIMFNIRVHDNDAVRLRADNIGDRCFDVKLFMEFAMYPICGTLMAVLLVCWIQSSALLFLCPSSVHLQDTAFAMCVVSTATLFLFVRSGAVLGQWASNLAESIRNERYLIGRELQDMAR